MDHLHRQEATGQDVEHTAPTLRSRSSSLLSRGGGGSHNNCLSSASNLSQQSSITSQPTGNHNRRRSSNNNNNSQRILGFLFSRVKIRTTRQWKRIKRRSKQQLSETNLRKQLKKYAERGDWEQICLVLSNYDFSDIPEEEQQSPTTFAAMSKSRLRGRSSNNDVEDPQKNKADASRRPSYGSRNSLRNSFTGKESAAAAAAIKAALLVDEEANSSSLEESSSSDNRRLDAGENILHDMCHYNPTLNVIETLLSSLRHHRRGYTAGKDEMGRTPLHVAAACGCDPQVIHALALADPSQASIGDVDGRTPLHIVTRYLAYRGRVEDSPPKEMMEVAILPPYTTEETFDDEAYERCTTTISILKDVMTTYPGKVDFKDEDTSGFSPLDYVLDGNISDEHVLHCLLRRKGLTNKSKRRSTASTATQVTGNRSPSNYSTIRRRKRSVSVCSEASSVCSQDIDVLLRLEEEEIDSRRKRLERLRPRRQKVKIRNTLFDVFGIEQQQQQQEEMVVPSSPQVSHVQKMMGIPIHTPSKKVDGDYVPQQSQPQQPPPALQEKIENTPINDDDDAAAASDSPTAPPPRRRRSSRKLLPISRSFPMTSSKSDSKQQSHQRTPRHSMTSADIYEAHLAAYMDDFMDENLERYDENDSFDILQDPDEVEEEETGPHHKDEKLLQDDKAVRSSPPPIFEINIRLDEMMMQDNRNRSTWNDDFSDSSRLERMSVVSEISVPAILVHRESGL